jgi:hypothetical protein
MRTVHIKRRSDDDDYDYNDRSTQTESVYGTD